MQTPNITEQVKQAAMQPKLKYCTDAKIKDALIQVYTLIGIKEGNIPTNKQVIYDYLKNDIGNYTVVEFMLAFRMFVKSRLDYVPRDVSSIQSFSTIFIENVMQAYSRFRGKFITTSTPASNQPQPSSKQIQQIFKNGAIECFARYGRTGILLDWGNPTYDYLDKCGLISKKYDDFLEEARPLVREDFIKSKRKDWMEGQSMSHHLSALEAISQAGSKKVLNQAKRIALASWFDELIELQTELKDLI